MQAPESPDYFFPYLMSPDCSPSPLRRGPMYSAYAELREWNIRRKIARSNSPISAPSRVPDLNTSYRKENKKPDMSPLCLPPSGLRPKVSPVATNAPSMTPKIHHRRAGSGSSIQPPSYYQRMDMPATPRHPVSEPRKAVASKIAAPKGGSGVYSLTRSYSYHKEVESESDDVSVEREDRRGRTGQKPTLTRVPSLRRQNGIHLQG